MKIRGYDVKKFTGKTKRFCQTMELKGNPELIAKYCEAHDEAHQWKIIRDGIREVGILEMEIYILENRLFMIVETPVDFDWDIAMKKLATLPKQQEWEDYVAQFQDCQPGQSSNQKWQMMTRMFYLYD